jgi:uncharacterized protein YqeY
MTSTPPAVPPAAEPGGDVRERLRLALRAAMKARDTVAVSALRSVLAAIANAEAVPPAEASPADGSAPAVTGNQYVAGSTAGLGATEAGRRELTGDEVAAIVRAEAAERRAACRHYRAAGQAGQAERLLREAQVIEELFLTAD